MPTQSKALFWLLFVSTLLEWAPTAIFTVCLQSVTHLFSITKTFIKASIEPDTCSSPLTVSSRPSAQKQASWLCENAAWKSPTKTSRSPRRTSCTRSRRAHQRGFTSNLQNLSCFFSPPLPHLTSIYRCVKERRQQLSCLSPPREFWYILCMSWPPNPTLLLPLRV